MEAVALSLPEPPATCVRAAVEREVAAIFSQSHAPLARYLKSVGISSADAEEVAQDTFMALFLHLRAGKRRDNLRGWIFRTGRNLALKRRQANSREILADPPPPAAGPEACPETNAVLAAERQRLEAVVRALPGRDRECLLLRAEGLRYREIAETLDMSLGAVAASLSKSFSRLSNVSDRP